MSFTFSHLAGVNEGVITSVWAVTPLFGALLDYLVFGVKLTKKHLVGVLTLVFCATLISLSSFTAPVTINENATMAAWVPVATAMLGSVLMSIRSL